MKRLILGSAFFALAASLQAMPPRDAVAPPLGAAHGLVTLTASSSARPAIPFAPGSWDVKGRLRLVPAGHAAQEEIRFKDWIPQRCTQEVGATYLCLRDGRFRVDLVWRTDLTDDTRHAAHPVPLNNGSGTFWFFSEDNSEALVKVLDGCGVNGRRWVFFATVTNVEFTLQVSDLETGVGTIWYSQLGQVYRPVQNTDAFRCD